jgi:hypothetical protein
LVVLQQRYSVVHSLSSEQSFVVDFLNEDCVRGSGGCTWVLFKRNSPHASCMAGSLASLVSNVAAAMARFGLLCTVHRTFSSVLHLPNPVFVVATTTEFNSKPHKS